MGMRIGTNVASINAQRSLVGTQREMQKSFAQLSSGSRITKAADDAAGLAISENLKGQIRSFTQAQRNANDGISMIQTAEGALSESSNIVTRMRELAVQGASDTIGDKERTLIQKEVGQLKSEIDRIAQSTKFGSKELLSGNGEVFDFQVGINNSTETDVIQFDSSQADGRLDTIGLSGIDFSTKEGSREALSQLDDASAMLNGYRAGLGAIQNRLSSTADNIGVMSENLSQANSRIRDADVASSTAESARNNVLLQASTAVLSQANQTPSLALKLL